jgi:hypothetical protein
MGMPELFKYNTLISIPLFSVIALWLIRKAPDFSFTRYTVSKSIFFLKDTKQGILFRLNFVLKAALDLGFAWYILYFFKISFYSPLSALLISSALLFGILAYFTESRNSLLHNIIAYTSGIFWAAGQVYLAYLIGNSAFRLFTYVMVIFPVIFPFGYMIARKTDVNVFVQITCMSVWYIWLVRLVFQYL